MAAGLGILAEVRKEVNLCVIINTTLNESKTYTDSNKFLRNAYKRNKGRCHD